jgi:hypothetical protein
MIKLQKTNLSKGVQKHAFLILDDCIAKREVENPIMKKLAIMGRHFNISTILTSQYVHLIPPVIRANAHYNLFFNIGEGVITNFSQLVKNPDTIMTLADDFTIFDLAAYYKARNSGKNPIEKVNDIRNKVHRISSELLPHYKLTELIGPPELLPTGIDAYKRELSNLLHQKKKLQLTYDVDVLDISQNQFTSIKKGKYVKEKITELTTSAKHLLNKVKKKVKLPQSSFVPLTKDEINSRINSFSALINFSPLNSSPPKARLQQKLARAKQKLKKMLPQVN